MFTNRCHVMYDKFLPCKNRSVQFDWFWYCVKRQRISFFTLSLTERWDGSALHGYKCTSNICLRTCRGHSSHSSEMSVCRGLCPIPESPVRTFSHLSTCEILHTSHNWSMTVSANCIRCFFYMLFTQIIWIIVLVFWCIIFNVIALKLVVQVVVFFFHFCR